MRRLLATREIGRMERSEIERFQDRKFAAWVQTVLLPGSAAYRDLFRARGVSGEDISGIRDWQRLGLPLIRKSDYRVAVDHYRLRLSAEGLDHYAQFCATVGDLDAEVEVARFRGLTVRVATAGMRGAAMGAATDPAVTEVAADYLDGVAGAFLTGGTSGAPTPVYHSRLDRDLFRIAAARLAAAHGAWLDARHARVVAANLYPHAAHQAWWVLHWGLDAAAHGLIGLSGGGVTPTERIVELLSLFEVSLVTGMPGYIRNRLVPAMKTAARAGRRFAPHMVVSLGAETIPGIARDEIAAELHAAGVDHVWVCGAYGASELRFLVFAECPGHASYHSVAPDLAAVRTVSLRSPDDWTFTEPGEEGAVAVFPLDGTGTSLVGFLLGDLATLAPHRCDACGSATDRLLELRRETDVELQLQLMGVVEGKVRGATVNLSDLREQLLTLAGVQEVQLVVERTDMADAAAQDVLRVRVAPREGEGRTAELVTAVAATTKRLTEVQPVVETVALADLHAATLKFRAIVDARWGGG
jgi:phenylacetate-coenzyme A ligase PaaK-like adenylate-forming protein